MSNLKSYEYVIAIAQKGGISQAADALSVAQPTLSKYIKKLEEELEPHLVILEATGVATPDTMANNLRKYGGYPVRIVTLVDAARWQRIKLALSILLTAQIEPADIVCVNKVDLAEADVLDEIDADVRAINPDAPIVHMSASEPVDAELLDRIVGY
jgi:G3E family GTPase